MKFMLAALASLALIAVSPGAGAGFESGTTLLEKCGGGEAEKAACSGYILAIADVLAEGPHFGWRACMPEGVRAGQVKKAVVRWLGNNPRILHYEADGLVAKALSDAFPCR